MQLPFSFSLDQRTNHSSLSSESLLLHLYPSQNTRNKIPTEVTISPLYRATFSHNALFQGTILRQVLHGAIATRFYVITSIWRHVRPSSWQIQNGGTGSDWRQCACRKSTIFREFPVKEVLNADSRPQGWILKWWISVQPTACRIFPKNFCWL